MAAFEAGYRWRLHENAGRPGGVEEVGVSLRVMGFRFQVVGGRGSLSETAVRIDVITGYHTHMLYRLATHG